MAIRVKLLVLLALLSSLKLVLALMKAATTSSRCLQCQEFALIVLAKFGILQKLIGQGLVCGQGADDIVWIKPASAASWWSDRCNSLLRCR